MLDSKLLHLSIPEITNVFKAQFVEITELARNNITYDSFISQLKIYLIGIPTNENRNNLAAKNRILLMCDDIAGNTLDLLRLELKDEQHDVHPDFMIDMYHLFLQLYKEEPLKQPDSETVVNYMNRWETATEPLVMAERDRNKNRIIELLVSKIANRSQLNSRYCFNKEMDYTMQLEQVHMWWTDFRFHLTMAIRSPQELQLFMDNTLSEETMKLLIKAKEKGIPFFITPYYLSLLNCSHEGFDDRAIRSYIIYSDELVDEFNNIHAWEKEDIVIPGKPNAAGWLLPNAENIHRRYPEVAILIPDTIGRACGGLCAPCQRMFNFQKGILNFNLEKLAPKETWSAKLESLMEYFENDSQLQDILITGGDALMSKNESLRKLLEAVYQMALRKREANKARKVGDKYAEIYRVRLGTRLLAYLPFRINDELVTILREFKEKAEKIGVKQFLIQTHFETPLEVTPEALKGIQMIQSAGWIITNQLVYTVAASRRGHTAQLRRQLNLAGVVGYYTFSVKGFNENKAIFTPNSRSVQEMNEEKSLGQVSKHIENELSKIFNEPELIQEKITSLLNASNIPFIATDRNVMNLPGIGKSMNFETVGVTPEGCRILNFTLDPHRPHSPAVDKNETTNIIENKSVASYLRQLETMGESVAEYESIWSYNSSISEARFKLYTYADNKDMLTKEVTNIQYPNS
jgi:lysine 2,3-aminomutase